MVAAEAGVVVDAAATVEVAAAGVTKLEPSNVSAHVLVGGDVSLFSTATNH
jgi:hypothetical protein